RQAHVAIGHGQARRHQAFGGGRGRDPEGAYLSVRTDVKGAARRLKLPDTARVLTLPEADLAEADLDRQTIEILYQVGEALGDTPDVGLLLEQLGNLAIRATGAERCGVFLVDSDGTKLEPVAGAVRGGDRDLLSRRFKETEPIDVSVDAPWEVFGT